MGGYMMNESRNEQFGKEIKKISSLDALDYQVTLSIEPATDLSKLSKKFGISSEVGLYLTTLGYELNLFFKKNRNMDRELEIFLGSSKAIRKNNIWRVSQKTDEKLDFIDGLQDLLAVPSAVLVSIWLSKGRFYLEAIFHHSDLEKISNKIVSYRNPIHKLKIEYIGASNGYLNVIKKISERTKLSIATIRMTIPPEEIMVQRNPLENPWTRVLKISHNISAMEAIYFTEEMRSNSKEITEIVPNKIYGAPISNAFFDKVNKKMYDERIISIGLTSNFESPILVSVMIFPTIFKNDIFRILSEVSKDFLEWESVVERLQSLDSFLEDIESDNNESNSKQ
jgi:hypothetical protein